MKMLFTIIAVVYVLMPHDLIPDYLLGPGWLDDLILVGLVWYFFFSPKSRYSRGRGNHRSGDDTRTKTEDGPESGKREEAVGKDAYQILGVSRNATVAEIKKQYKILASKYHPDKVAHLGTEFQQLGEQKFKEIQEAYQTIINSR